MVVTRLGAIEDRATARELLLEAARNDADRSIRMIAAMQLGTICAPGDYDVADSLDAIAAAEPEELQTRPMMEYVSEYLRTGVEDSRFMAPRP